MTEGPCPVCKSPSRLASDGRTIVSCRRCGDFLIGTIALHLLQSFSGTQIANLSGWIRENQNCLIAQPDLDRLGALRTPTVGEKADKLLLFLSRNFPKLGQQISLAQYTFQVGSRGSYGRGLYGICWCQDQEEFLYILHTFLRDEKKFIHADGPQIGMDFTITPSGWSYLDSLRRGDPNSQTAFIAMWFNDSVNDAWKAIDQAIRDSGYSPLRIDQKQHNNKIDDEIVAGIRRSKFLVADFTGHRGGVYFEAGLAMGLGLPVIWLCRKDDLASTHFDTRQYNFIVWETDKLGELSKALQYRIEATIGQGRQQFVR